MARIPWVKMRIDLPASEKLAGLPGADNPHPGWGYTCLLAAAKTQRRMGVFAGRSHLAAVVSQAAPFVEAYVEAGLLHVAPRLCDECAPRHADDDLKAGELVVHDYRKEQRDPTNADRQDAHRAEQKLRALTQALEDAGIDVQLVAGTKARVTPDTVTPTGDDTATPSTDVTANSVTDQPAPIDRPRRNANVTADSRARGTTVTVTETTTESTTKKNGSDGTVSVATEARDPEPLLSDPNRAGRPRSSTPSPGAPRMPAGLEAVTPKWRHPCSDYTRHFSRHRIIDGVAVCDACEERIAAEAVTPPAVSPVNGAQDGFGLA